MIVVTLVCVALGGLGARIEYLRRWAAFHDGKADECLARIDAYSAEGREPDDEYKDELNLLIASAVRHLTFSAHYRRAAYHYPWTVTDESTYDRGGLRESLPIGDY
jgi:hypothetical protein